MSVPVKPLPETLKVAVPAVALLRGTVREPVCPDVPFAEKVPVAEAVPQLNAKEAITGLTNTEGVHVPVACAEVTVIVLLPAVPEPLKVKGTETDVCPAAKLTAAVPEKPLPDTVIVATPSVAPVIGTFNVPACPPTPLATKVPDAEAVPQLNVKEVTVRTAL